MALVLVLVAKVQPSVLKAVVEVDVVSVYEQLHVHVEDLGAISYLRCQIPSAAEH